MRLREMISIFAVANLFFYCIAIENMSICPRPIVPCLGRLAAALLAVMVLLTVPGCKHGDSSSCVDKTRYAQLDSMLNKIKDADSLAALATQSREQNDHMSEIIALRCQGRVLRNQSRFGEALTVHSHGLEVATRCSDTIEISLALNNIGTDYRRMGDLSMANGYYYESLKLIDVYSERDGDDALKARITALNGIGNIEIEMQDYYTADSVLRQSLAGELRLGRNVGIAMNYGNLGAIKSAIGEIDSAWVYFRKSMEYNKLAGSDLGVALCHQHFGDLHLDERRFSHALKEYKQAYDMLKELGDSWHWMGAGLAMARVNILLGEKAEAGRYLDEVVAEATRTGSKEYQAEASDIYYELSLLEGNAQEALRHYVHSKELYDSIYGLKRYDEMRSQRVNYERGRASGELDLLTRDISNLKRQRSMQVIFTMVLLLMAVAIIAALVYAVRVRSRTQRIMRQIEETRSLFFTNVVHQLRTPLTAIMGAIDGIVNDKNAHVYSAQQRENALLIEQQGENLLVLVDRILEVGGVRSAIKELDWRHGDAVTFIRMLLESYRERCVEQHIELTYAPRENSVEIDTVPRYLTSILGSLIDNAISYSRELGKITVTSHVEGGMLVIRVADNGMGISKADLPHVFEPFYRTATAEHLCDGVGIGLTVVRDMTMAMGGTVAVDSMKDQGSIFTVKLPCKHGHGNIKMQLGQAIAPVRRVVRRSQNETIQHPEQAGDADKPVVLIVEDHLDVARLVGQVLGPDYQIHYASDGEQGLSQAGQLVPDLIITDVKMPSMDGLELCRRIRQSRSLCDIPVIMLSARNSDTDRVRGVEAGADAYLVKPFVSEELKIWVIRLLESRRVLREVYSQPAEQEPVESAQSTTDEMSAEDKDFLMRFAAEVDKRSAGGGKLDFDKLALAFKMGESQLRRKIQTLTGKSVTAYITMLRMDKAMRLLQNERDMLIGDIADKCGFQDVAYFSRVFRQYYGKTPTQARNMSHRQ